MSAFFHAVFYNPIYNALVALISLIPGGDVGVAVVLLTVLIRFILLPFSFSAARTQRVMKVLEPRLKEVKENHKDDKEKEALATLALYKDAQVNPFASILTAFIQIPVLLALYWVFYYEPFPAVNTSILYSFTPVPQSISLHFLGILLVSGKSLLLAFLAGIAQYLQAHMALLGTLKPSDVKSVQNDFQKIMGMQLKYVFPFIIGVISYTTSGAIAIYFITTNLAGSVQEWYVRRKLDAEAYSA